MSRQQRGGQGAKATLCAFILLAAAMGCERNAASLAVPKPAAEARPLVVVTTNILADLVATLAGDALRVEALMGPGVDPHLYKASEGDVATMADAQLVLYNGLHLEGKMTDVFARMRKLGRRVTAVAEALPPERLLAAEGFAGNYDPHVWFDVALWRLAVTAAAEALAAAAPEVADTVVARAAVYDRELAELDAWVRAQMATIPAPRRVLVTAHDAFGYLGRAYSIEVRGLLGISTASEAGAADVQELAALIAARGVPAIFVESTVSPRYIEALQQAVRARGAQVAIGGHLYSDALGAAGSGADTYVGMVRHNVTTIVRGLRGDQP